jgi:D-alanyl-D-alanine carboxypeptidase
MSFPLGLDEIVAEYGDPKLYVRADGTVHHAWEAIALGTCVLPAGITLGWDETTKVSRVRVHRKLITPLGEVMKEIHTKGFWPLLKTFDGCYAWRAKRAGKKLSTHAWGIAIDLNADTNELGQKGDMPPEIVQVFMKHGWEWGGHWLQRPDPMHFQACRGY